MSQLYSRGGPKAILAIGQDLDRVTHDPIWSAAISSSDPWVLLDKWRRFEVYAHWNNRTEIKRQSEFAISARRYAEDGSSPTVTENLLVCSLLLGLLRQIGCRGISCSLGLKQTVCIQENDLPTEHSTIDEAASRQWAISWTHHQSRTSASVSSKITEQLINVHNVAEPVIKAVDHLLLDPSRAWTVTELAKSCHVSQRTLQRRLSESDLSFSKIVRLVRVHEACHLLENTDLPATAISFCAGFSDSAHFSRDFSASIGVSPSVYRTLLQTATPIDG